MRRLLSSMLLILIPGTCLAGEYSAVIAQVFEEYRVKKETECKNGECKVDIKKPIKKVPLRVRKFKLWRR